MKIIESIAKKNRCYTAGRKIVVCGQTLHSVGCPQPKASVFARFFDRFTLPELYTVEYVPILSLHLATVSCVTFGSSTFTSATICITSLPSVPSTASRIFRHVSSTSRRTPSLDLVYTNSPSSIFTVAFFTWALTQTCIRLVDWLIDRSID